MLQKPFLYAFNPFFSKVNKFVSNPKTHQVVLKTIVSAVLFAIVLMTSLMLYFSFYYWYIPNIQQHLPVFFDFGTDKSATTLLPLNLPNGQSYDLTLEVQLPQSSKNMEVGNFMIESKIKSSLNDTLYTSVRAGAVTFYPVLLRYVNQIIFWFPLLLGFMNFDTQIIRVPLLQSVASPLPDWIHEQPLLALEQIGTFKVDQPQDPYATFMEINMRSHYPIHVYESQLHLEAKFHGVRYFMYHWFFTSATIGIAFIMLWELFFLLAIWKLCVSDSDWVETEAQGQRPPMSPHEVIIPNSESVLRKRRQRRVVHESTYESPTEEAFEEVHSPLANRQESINRPNSPKEE
eukprot:NODE_153_length_16933_cov_0.442141.p5 type:complete len:347 gc:universal NODE_153_length_16933_cov_0.442141:13093-12053(-)